MSEGLLAFGAYLSQKGYAPRTIQGYLDDLRRYERWLQSQAISTNGIRLTRDALQAYFQSLEEKGVSPGTTNRLIAALRAFERYQNNGSIPDGTLDAVARTEYSPEPTPEATRKDLRALIKEFHRQQSASRTERQTWHAVRNWAILQVLRETGLRAGKVCALRVESDAKTYTAGILREIFPEVELTTTARQALMDWLDVRTPGPGLLFTSYAGKPLQPCDLYRLMRTMSQRANVHVTPEMLR